MRSDPEIRCLVPQQGFSLLEVLVAVLILAIGLLGLVGLQARASMVEMEAYQRSVALQLVRDMASRIPGSREYLDDFRGETNGRVFGANTSLADGACDADPPSPARRDVCQWDAALRGVSATVENGGTEGSLDVGAPIGMRGCVIEDTQSPNALAEFIVVGVWQGLMPTASPPADTPGAECDVAEAFGDGLRRAVVTRVLVPRLAAE